MKKLLALLILVPSICFGAFTEFYCQSGGSNLNGGSDTNNTATYTSTSGNWSTSTFIFTPTDGSNPVTAGVTVGQWASLYLNAATTTVSTSRITAVTNAANGTITVSSSAKAGTVPATGTGTVTIKVGGAWKGPNANDEWPLISTITFVSATDSSGDRARINMQNGSNYNVSTAPNFGSSQDTTVQGYSSSPGDGGKATIDTQTNAVQALASTGQGSTFIDLIFQTSQTTNTTLDLVTSAATGVGFIRCVFHGAQGSGFNCSTNIEYLWECEAYANNKGNNAGRGGFAITAPIQAWYCFAHDNTGTNASGFVFAQSNEATLSNCIASNNGQDGIGTGSGTINPPFLIVINSDFYKNGRDGIHLVNGDSVAMQVVIQNCNFIKNTGAGINNTIAHTGGYAFNNGYGSGTMANGSADSLKAIVSVGSVTYSSGLTPWFDPDHGDFRINLAAANWAGRGAFTETSAALTAPNTVGYPDIGAAQSKTGPGGTFSKQVSHGSTQ